MGTGNERGYCRESTLKMATVKANLAVKNVRKSASSAEITPSIVDKSLFHSSCWKVLFVTMSAMRLIATVEPSSSFRHMEQICGYADGQRKSTIYLMFGKIRPWLNDHLVASLALWLAGVLFAFALFQILYRAIIGNWCP